MRLLAPLSVAFALLASAPAAAQPAPKEAATARLGSLRPAELSLLEPHLDRGPIAFVEFSTDTELPAVLMATRVRAPAERVAEVVSDPAKYPRFMPALDRVEVRSRRGSTVAYDWTWRTGVFSLRGSNVMNVYAPADGDDTRGWRVGVRSTGGDLGQGRMMWRIRPDGDGACTVVLAMRVDMRDANYIARRISSGGNSVNRTINISLGFVMLMATKTETEERAGTTPAAPKETMAELHPPDVDIRRLAPMLRRGDLLLLEMHGERIAQVSVVGRMGKSPRPVQRIMTRPEAFGRSLVHGSRAEVVERRDDGVLFDWSIPLPLVGAEGRMRLREDGPRISVDALRGGLAGGKWRFETRRYPWGEAVVVGWARFDPADTGWLVERLVDGIPWFGHGLAAASQVMVLRSIRSRVWGR